MKAITILSFLLSSFLIAGTGHNHSHHGHDHSHGHDHGHSHHRKSAVTKDQAKTLGMDRIKVLIFKNKINSSWVNAQFEKAELKEIKGKKEWLVTYINNKGTKGKKLYIFLKESGEFLAANFTGN